MSNNMKILTGFAVGALAGAVAGLLLAPESGPQTRRKLGQESEKLKNSLAHSLAETLDAAKIKYNTLLDEYARKSEKAAVKARQSAKVG
ncbi:hypothetical protein C900_05237 [Fulvivirga imtechensis AK7]|uniref:Gas vesicle protein n=2 Tax=Fulvivirga TaxID=396811 RepID=L8JYE6_9BACT|nr:hypothetical protein C900_05237 [Fulvivirga imtechensis AK7]